MGPQKKNRPGPELWTTRLPSPPVSCIPEGMKKRFSILAAALLSLPVLLLSSCQTYDKIVNGDNPYFGVGGKNKKFVPRELQEDRVEEEDYAEDYAEDYDGDY